MCIGDWRLGRLIRSQVFAWDTNILNPQPIPANNARIGLTICGTTMSATITAGHAIRFEGIKTFYLNPNNAFVHLTLETHGDLVTKACDIIATTTTASGSWIEYWMPEKYLAAALEMFNSQYGIRK